MILSRFVSIRCGRENLRTMIRKIFHPGMNAFFLSSTKRFIKILRAVLMHRPQLILLVGMNSEDIRSCC